MVARRHGLVGEFKFEHQVAEDINAAPATKQRWMVDAIDIATPVGWLVQASENQLGDRERETGDCRLPDDQPEGRIRHRLVQSCLGGEECGIGHEVRHDETHHNKDN